MTDKNGVEGKTVVIEGASSGFGRRAGEKPEQSAREDRGMRFAFWLWMATIVVGLVAMIAIPLTGR